MKILIFTKNWIGDVIFAEPLVRIVAQAYPQAEIICACPPRCIPFLEKNPHVTRCIAFDEKGRERSLWARMRFVWQLRAEAIDRAYIVHRSLSRVLLCSAAGIRERIGYDTKGRGRWLTRALPFDESAALGVHDAVQFAALAQMPNMGEEALRYRFYFDAADEAHVTDLLNEHAIADVPIIAINPGANWPPKRWFPERYAAVIDQLLPSFEGVFVITGSADNEGLAEDIISQVRGDARRVHSVCGKTSLTQVGALFARTQCVITADSGPMHIATGVGARVVALFGPTNHVRTGPFGVGQSHVLLKRVENFTVPCFDDARAEACMRNITVDMVCDAVRACLQERA